MERQRGSGLLWALVGCACLLVLGLCGATGVGVFLLMRAGSVPGAEPSAWPAPSPADPDGLFPSPDKPRMPSGGPMGRVRVTAEVTMAEGGVVAPGAACLFDVEVGLASRTGEPACRAQVVCGGQLVYGGQNAGYFPCEVSPGFPPTIRGGDGEPTAVDGDAAMALDTVDGTLSVQDRGGSLGTFRFEARVTEVQ